jgi:hypothetical protein
MAARAGRASIHELKYHRDGRLFVKRVKKRHKPWALSAIERTSVKNVFFAAIPWIDLAGL